ncbi:MAG TPA: hypothetical protein VMW56_09505 [Candidatus Margulisiibacteriota bacterium]|nr:hypothetical protein [Candidatus Margulisiibacteriota bacterium]
MPTWSKTRAAALLGALLPLAGCLMEHTVSVTNDGRVSFESLVSEPDPQKKIAFPQFEGAVTKLVEELREHKWKVEVAWLSKERPYRLKVHGSGKLAEISASTSLYDVGEFAPKRYKLLLRAPAGAQARAVFESPKDGAMIVDGKGQPAQEFDTTMDDKYLVIALE